MRDVFATRTWIGLLLVFALAGCLALEVSPDIFAADNGKPADIIESRQNVRTATLALFAGFLGILGSVYTARSYTLNREGQITDRFAKAIELLGSAELDVRLGGIYALERIARQSADDHPQVMEVLTAVVRERGRRSHQAQRLAEEHGAYDEELDAPPQDVVAALTVIARRNIRQDRAALDLSEAWLPFVRLAPGSNLEDADLSGSTLIEASFYAANLKNATLESAYVYKADFTDADLRGTNLSGVKRMDTTCISDVRADGSTLWPEDFRPSGA